MLRVNGSLEKTAMNGKNESNRPIDNSSFHNPVIRNWLFSSNLFNDSVSFDNEPLSEPALGGVVTIIGSSPLTEEEIFELW